MDTCIGAQGEYSRSTSLYYMNLTESCAGNLRKFLDGVLAAHSPRRVPLAYLSALFSLLFANPPD